MRITSLTLTAFKSYRDVTLALDAPRVVIGGVNAVGKTSIREAIRWVLTGKSQGLDGKGAGTAVLAPYGTDTAKASLTLTGIGTLTREAKNGSTTFSVEGMTGSSQIQQGALYGKLNASPAFLEACLDSGVFLNLHHAEAKALVLELLNVTIEVEGKKYTLAELDAAYKQAFEERTVAKKVLAGITVPTVEPYTGPSLEAIEAQLTKLRTAHDELIAQVGQTLGTRKVLTASLANLKGMHSTPLDTVGEIDGAIADLEARIAEMNAAPDTTSPGPVYPLHVMRSKMEACEAHKPSNGCVIWNELPCQTSAHQFELGAAYFKRKIAESPEVVGDPHGDAVKMLTTLKAKRERVVLLWEQHAQRALDIQKVEAELAALPDTAQTEEALATLKTRIAKGEDLVKAARSAHTAQEVAQAVSGRLTAAKAEVARLETLCEALGPSGARVQALQQAIGAFEGFINMSLKPFGWTLTFALDPWKVLANGRPVETYSKSEQHRIGIAMQLAISHMSELGFAIVDELDMLDKGNRTLMNGVLSKAAVEQIILLGTRELDQPLPKAKGVLSYRLSTGTGGTQVVEQASV